MEEEILSVKIDNKKPVELLEFTDTILGFNNCYNIWCKENKIEIIERCLYVNELREGSKIVNFIKKQSLKLVKEKTFNFFVSFYGEQINKLLEEKIEEVSKKYHNAIQQSLNYSKNDYKSNLSINSKIGNITNNTYNINGVEASAVDKLIEKSKELKEDYEIKENVILTISQAENSNESKRVDRGVIEDVYKNKVNVVYKNNIKQSILKEKENPFNMWFLVDVEVKKVKNKPVVYIVHKLHDKGNLN